MNRNFHILDEAERIIDSYIKKQRRKRLYSGRVLIYVLCSLCGLSFIACIVNIILWYTV